MVHEELIAAVAQSYLESLAGETELALHYRKVFAQENLAGPLAVALRNALVTVADEAVYEILESAHQKLANPPAHDSDETLETPDPGKVPSSSSEPFYSVFEAFKADWAESRVLNIHRHLADMVAAKPAGLVSDYRAMLHNMLHAVSDLDRRDPSNIPPETTLGLETLLEHHDEISASAVNTYAFSLLIPAGRYEEAGAMLSASAKNPSGFEAINALSNLSQVYLLSGMPLKAEALMLAVEATGQPSFVVEACYWLGHIYLAAGGEKEGQAKLADALFAAEIAEDSSYAEKAKACITGKCSEPEFTLGDYPTHVVATDRHSDIADFESIPDFEQAQAAVREALGLGSEIIFDVSQAPAVGPWTTADWVDLLDQSATEWGKDWNIDDPAVGTVAYLLSRSDSGRREGAGEWIDRHVFRQKSAPVVTADLLLGHLVDASSCAACSGNMIHTMPGLACSLGVVLLEGLQDKDSEQSMAFRSRVTTIVLEALVRSRKTELVDQWLQRYPGDETDSEWLLWASLAHSQCDRLPESLALIEKSQGKDLLTQSVQVAHRAFQGVAWEEVCGLWDSVAESASKVVYRSLTGKKLIRWTLKDLDGPDYWASSPLAALALGMFGFYEGSPTLGAKHWFSVGPVFGGTEEIKVLRRSLVESHEIDIDELVARASAFSTGRAIALLYKHKPVDCILALSRNTFFVTNFREGNPDILEFVGNYLVNDSPLPPEERFQWPLDVEALFALALGTANEAQTQEFSRHERLEVRLLVASSTSLTDSIVAEVLLVGPPAEQTEVALALLRNPSVSLTWARIAAEHVPGDSLWKAAAESTVPSEILVEWAKHESSSVRRAVAGNPNTPEEVLGELALDSSLAVRDAVLGNPSASDETRALVKLQD